MQDNAGLSESRRDSSWKQNASTASPIASPISTAARPNCGGIFDFDAKALKLEELNRELETLIRQCPGQYLWGYNRYKVPSGAEPPQTD